MAMSVVYSNAFGRVIAENRGGVVSRYVTDTQGSTIGLVSSSGVLTDRWVYWPYGEVASRAGTNVTPLTWLGTIGYFLDALPKLFYVRARHLRADLARWLTVDGLWPRQAAYPYVGCWPTSVTDPSGLQGGAGGGSAGGVVPWLYPFCVCAPMPTTDSACCYNQEQVAKSVCSDLVSACLAGAAIVTLACGLLCGKIPFPGSLICAIICIVIIIVLITECIKFATECSDDVVTATMGCLGKIPVSLSCPTAIA